jgi:hypothetical protein
MAPAAPPDAPLVVPPDGDAAADEVAADEVTVWLSGDAWDG